MLRTKRRKSQEDKAASMLSCRNWPVCLTSVSGKNKKDLTEIFGVKKKVRELAGNQKCAVDCRLPIKM